MKKENDTNKKIVEWCEAITFALVVLVLVFTFGIRVAGVRGSSMYPTLREGERVILQNSYSHISSGDVVVIDSFIPYGKPLVKRIIATGGDTIEIDSNKGVVYVNGSAVEEPYIAEPTCRAGDMQYPLVVPEGQLFVMGDNRMHSTDSRFELIGLIDSNHIQGKVLFKIFPLNEAGAVK